MTASRSVKLSHRRILSVSGGDARDFLERLITNSLGAEGDRSTRYAALLTPQGKVIADFLIFPREGHWLLDCDAGAADDLVRRLSMFKLRSDVTVTKRDELCAIAFAGDADPRRPRAPTRSIGTCDAAEEEAGEMDVASYHAARIAAALPEQGIDFQTAEVFPADINMDAYEGIDFSKGCFVGQEVVSRMKRRGTARRRTLVFEFDGEGATGTLMAGEVEIGTITSVSGPLGLGRLRIDRLAEAEASGETITVGGSVCRAIWPDWLDRP